MFYSAQILAKKGPLGIIWLAAHMDGRLKRHNITDTDISSSVDSIMHPEAPLALRLSGQLLLGVVKIYDKQIVFLYEDCNEILTKLQLAFKADKGGTSKPAPAGHITMPDDYQPFGTWDEAALDFDVTTVDLSQLKPFQVSGSKDRLLTMDDRLAAFNSPLLYENEQFEVSGEDLERHLSMTPAEVMRNAPEPEVQRLFVGQDGPSTPYPSNDADLLPDAPMDDGFMMELAGPPSARPSSLRTPFTLPTSLSAGKQDSLMPDDGITIPQLEVEPDSAREERQGQIGLRANSKQKPTDKRKRAEKDIDQEGRPATTISSSVFREQLSNRAPILRERCKLTKHALLDQQPRNPQHVANYNTAATRWMEQPSLGMIMAPQLYLLYSPGQPTICKSQHQKAEQDYEKEPAGNALMAAQPDEHATPGTMCGVEAAAGDHDAGAEVELHQDQDVMCMGTDLALGSPPRTEALPMSPTDSRRPSSSRKRIGLETSYEEGVGSPWGSNYATRTEGVLAVIQSRVQGKHGGKKQRLSGAAAEAVMFHELPGAGNRLEAARLFFDLLTLQSRNKITLQQVEAFQEMQVSLPSF